MDYVIKNHKNIYIKLNENGSPVTCGESDKGLFEQAKAKNILASLPKTLRRLNFRVDCIPDIPPKIIQSKNYKVSDDIKQWVDKFGMCGDILNEATKRMEFLVEEQRKLDNELIDILHIIEIENSKDLYNGWLQYKHIRENREKRRLVKDEIIIVGDALKKVNSSCFQRERLQKSIDGLFTRKYTFRVVEEETDNDTV